MVVGGRISLDRLPRLVNARGENAEGSVSEGVWQCDGRGGHSRIDYRLGQRRLLKVLEVLIDVLGRAGSNQLRTQEKVVSG